MPRDGWHPPVIRVVATENRGVEELASPGDKLPQHSSPAASGRHKHIEHWQKRLIELPGVVVARKVLGGKEGETRACELIAVEVAEIKKDPFSRLGFPKFLKGPSSTYSTF